MIFLHCCGTSTIKKTQDYEPVDMALVDGSADEVVPEQHRYLQVGLLGSHVRRHGGPERPSSKNHHLHITLHRGSSTQSGPGSERGNESTRATSGGIQPLGQFRQCESPCAWSRGRRCGCGRARTGTTV
jgi:hypothetical protein